MSTPHKCPVCDGTGLVSKPPGLPGDILTWDRSSDAGPFTCPACYGSKIVWEPESTTWPMVSPYPACTPPEGTTFDPCWDNICYSPLDEWAGRHAYWDGRKTVGG